MTETILADWQIRERLVDNPPLIDDLTICSRCRFLSYCGRAVSAAPEPEPEEDHELFGDLEPDR